MKSGPQIAMAVAVGYILGRSRKMKLAITVGGMMAGRRLAGNPAKLLEQGGKLLAESPELKKLTGDARQRLLEAAKGAALAAASNKIDSLGANLSKRAEGLRTPHLSDVSAPKQDTGQEEPQDEAEDRDEEREERPARSSARGGERPAQRQEPERRSSGSAGQRARSATASTSSRSSGSSGAGQSRSAGRARSGGERRSTSTQRSRPSERRSTGTRGDDDG
ncbi:hypothetical protein A8924_1369 [Saccharopolyspora erythraea NRRL 2338]|nr:hypothetical protein [Saccharopolyspora erythraea]PFG94103.1 hypothetical protein A8924_1369 [Saccharopolyspora erythraea NRRL 2338]